jgi:hypothetical protein
MKRISILKYLLILFLFAGLACEEVVLDPVFTVGKESTFRINTIYPSTDHKYTVQIKEISDSRCPEGVVCIWSGEVSIKGELTADNQTIAFEIHSVADRSNVVPEGFTIKIVDAQPYPKYGIETKPEDMVVTLLIQKY